MSLIPRRSTPQAVIAACHGASQHQRGKSGAKMTAMVINTTSILARITCEGDSGALATRSAASSPEMVSQASPPRAGPPPSRSPASPARAPPAVGEAAPEQQRRRQQIEELHQGLRDQPGIAAEQDEFLASQRLLPRSAAKGPSAGAGRAGDGVGRRGDRGVGKPRPRRSPSRRRAATGLPTAAAAASRYRRCRARRPPQDAVGPGASAVAASEVRIANRDSVP